jgi:hypothetical protein
MKAATVGWAFVQWTVIALIASVLGGNCPIEHSHSTLGLIDARNRFTINEFSACANGRRQLPVAIPQHQRTGSFLF